VAEAADAPVDGDDRGDVAVGWNSAPHGAEYRVRRAGSRHWSRLRAVPGATTPFIRLDALAFDRRGGLHMAVNHFRGQRSPGLRVLAETDGRWRDS
jgi:hypothetical protein